MKIDIIQSHVSDNYFFLLTDDDGSDGILIDPVDSKAALERVQALGAKVTRVLNTHWHPDHVLGNDVVLAETGAELLIPIGEQERIKGNGRTLSEGDTLSVGDVDLSVLLTPGHTEGHLSLLTPGHFFCGDTIFIGGAGNCYSGDPKILFETFETLAATVPDDAIIYAGHNYAVRNLEFCIAIEPDKKALTERLAQARAYEGLVRWTIGEEKSYSPFFRTGEPELQERLKTDKRDIWNKFEGLDNAKRAFVVLRELRNKW